MQVVGVEGCRDGWVAVVLRDGRLDDARFYPTLGAISGAYPDAVGIAVDIPIGLEETRCRPVDREARAFLGDAAASVFPTPPRPVLQQATFAAANGLCRRMVGHGIAKQAFELRHRIFEAEAARAADSRIFEVHPEVCFLALARTQPPTTTKLPSKKRWSGFWERYALLQSVGIDLSAPLAETGAAGPDDVLDAAVAAHTAERERLGIAVKLEVEGCAGVMRY